jgi:hypothetical protein
MLAMRVLFFRLDAIAGFRLIEAAIDRVSARVKKNTVGRAALLRCAAHGCGEFLA